MSKNAELPPSLEDSIHTVLKTNFHPDHKYDNGKSEILVGMGCFWGAERLFWNKMPTGEIYSTSVGYSGGAGGETGYKSVCSGRTGHTEVVRLVYEKESLDSRDLFQKEMASRGIDNKITTEIGMIKNFYLGELYHQQYLDKNPFGYCGLRGSGVACPLPLKKKNKN